MLLTWSIFLAFNAGKVSLILRTSEVEAAVFDAWAYNLLPWDLDPLLPMFLLTIADLLGWKYLDMVFISFLDLAGRGGGGGALLILQGSIWERPS